MASGWNGISKFNTFMGGDNCDRIPFHIRKSYPLSDFIFFSCATFNDVVRHDFVKEIDGKFLDLNARRISLCAFSGSNCRYRFWAIGNSCHISTCPFCRCRYLPVGVDRTLKLAPDICNFAAIFGALRIYFAEFYHGTYRSNSHFAC